MRLDIRTRRAWLAAGLLALVLCSAGLVVYRQFFAGVTVQGTVTFGTLGSCGSSQPTDEIVVRDSKDELIGKQRMRIAPDSMVGCVASFDLNLPRSAFYKFSINESEAFENYSMEELKAAGYKVHLEYSVSFR